MQVIIKKIASSLTTKSEKLNEAYFFSTILILFGIFLSVGIYFYYQSSVKLTLKNAITQQENILKHNAHHLDAFATTASELSNFIQKSLNGKNLKKQQIEDLLSEYLNSAPKQSIYGIGIWYKPYKFDKNTKYFGPYIHHDKENTKTITYEWNTQAYDYPSQKWYSDGLYYNGESTVIEPYFDNGLVYVTISRAFFDENKQMAGVITVDMTLPQLDKVISKMNTSEYEVIYLTTKDFRLLAHPAHEKFTELKKSQSSDYVDNLLQYSAVDIDNTLKFDHSNWHRTVVPLENLEWNLVAESPDDFLLTSDIGLRKSLSASFIALWIFIFILVMVTVNYYSQKAELEKNIEEGQIKLLHNSKMAALGEMAGGIAHEINTPLTIIASKADKISSLLKKPPYDFDLIQSDIEKIKKTSLRIGKIVKGLRVFSRSADNDPYEIEDVNHLINEALSLCYEKFKGHGVEVKFSPEKNLEVVCQSTQIVQVLLNLLNNAFDAVMTNNEKWIEIRSEDVDENFLCLKVIDSGKGLSSEIAKKIMQPFFTTKEVGKGTGLGLSISKGIVETHGGKLYLDNDAKQTTFVVVLPKSSAQSAKKAG